MSQPRDEKVAVQDIVNTDERKKIQLTPESAAHYIHAATSDNTQLAYQTATRYFLKQGGALPAISQMIIAYLKQCVGHYNSRTHKRHYLFLFEINLKII